MPGPHVLTLCCVAIAACSAAPAKPSPPPAVDPATAVSVEVPADPCTYSGRLRISAPVYARADGDGLVAQLIGDPFDSSTFVDATVTPPAARGQRARIAITAPMAVTGWLHPGARPLAARERIDIVPDHLWLDPSYEVTAFDPRDGTIEVAEPIPSSQGITAEPNGVNRRVDCEDLALSSMAGFIGPTAAEGEPFVVVGGDGRDIAAFDGPDGNEIARVRGGTHMQVVERAGAWVRVTESEPVHVDVWIRAASTSPDVSDTNVPGGVYLPNP